MHCHYLSCEGSRHTIHVPHKLSPASRAHKRTCHNSQLALPHCSLARTTMCSCTRREIDQVRVWPGLEAARTHSLALVPGTGPKSPGLVAALSAQCAHASPCEYAMLEPTLSALSSQSCPPCVQRVCGRLAASEKATGHDGASSGPHWPELPRPGVDGRVLCWSAPGGVPSERLRRLALARSEHRRSARLGEASAWSPPGSRNAGQGGHRRPKTCSEWARGVFAVWQYCQNQAVARSGSARDVDLVR